MVMTMSEIRDRSNWVSCDSEYPKITVKLKCNTEGLPSSSVAFVDSHRVMNQKCVCTVVMR